MSQVTPVPEGFHTATPFLSVRDAQAALSFYRAAFNAEIIENLRDDAGRVRHCEIRIGTSMFMLGECQEVQPLGAGSFPPISIYLYVDDADATFRRAIEAGAKQLYPIGLRFYGNREGGVVGPDGNTWWIATRVEVVSSGELARRHQAQIASAGH